MTQPTLEEPFTDGFPRFDLVPGESVGPIRLGMSRAEAIAALGAYPGSGVASLDRAGAAESAEDEELQAFESCLQIDFARGKAAFIGVSWDVGCGCDFTLEGRHLGTFTAIELVELLSALDDAGADEAGADREELPQEADFQHIRVTLWEPAPQYDELCGGTVPRWAQIGVYAAGYYD